MQQVLQVFEWQSKMRLSVTRSLTLTRKALCPMKSASAKSDTAHLPANERALLLCERALELKDRGDFDRAREVLRPFWEEFGERPDTKGLDPQVTGEILMCTGILTSWIGNQNQIREAHDWARDLLTESIRFYEPTGDLKKVGQAQTEIAYCYFRSGAVDEARIMFSDALEKLTFEGNARANALLGLSVVAWSSSRYDEALKILTDNSRLFRKIGSHILKGFYHNQLAMVLRSIAPAEKKTDYFRRAIKEYAEAEFEFKMARNTLFRAEVQNNVGFLLCKLARFRQAHTYLNEARRLALLVRNKVVVAQIDDTCAQVLIAEKKLTQAEAIARAAVASLKKSGHQHVLADAMITHGIALARLGKSNQAEFNFREAIRVAHEIGALNRAGLAALTLIEEIDHLPPDVLAGAYQQADEWLSNCQSQELLLRFKAAGTKLALKLLREKGTEGSTQALFNMPIYLTGEIWKFEHALISQALGACRFKQLAN